MNNRRRLSIAEEMGLGSRLEFYGLMAAFALAVVVLAYGVWL